MAVTTMRLVNITGTLSRLDRVLDVCADSVNFQFEQAMSFFGNKSDFAPINDENPYAPLYARLNTLLSEAGFEPDGEAKELSEPPVSWNELEQYLDDFAAKIKDSSDKRRDIELEISRLTDESAQLEHFRELDIRLDEIFECEYIKVRFGKLPLESFNRLKYYIDNPYIMMMECSRDKEYVWGVYFSPIDNVAEVDRIFQSLMWERMYLPDATETPAEECKLMRRRIEQLRGELSNTEEALGTFWQEYKTEISQVLSLLDRRKERFELRRNVARYKTGDRFFLAGWVPAKKVESFCRDITSIDSVDCEIELPDVLEGHSPPVKLKNNRLVRPFEFYVNMYGLPDYNEVDPTPFVALTYFLLFGMMFADAGQGIILSLIGWFFMWKAKKMELGRIMALCGISSVFFGILLGSVFGFEHWLDGFWGWVHDKTGVPLNEGKLINIEDSQMITTLIYATIGIGAVLVMCAMLLCIFTNIKQKKLGAALFSQNGLAGLVFYVSVVYAAVQALLFKNNVTSTAYILLLIVLPLIIVFIQEPLTKLISGEKDWMPEKIGDFLMQNFFELFEVILSYVSNTVSFLRVGAFILVHYGMMTVVFTLAEMNPTGSFGYIAVVVLGNIIVIALEGLLTGIQALRLEYYEMFSRFYSGTGKPFNAIGQNN